MGVELLKDESGTRIVMVCTTTDTAFGPVLTIPEQGAGFFDCVDDYAKEFLEWLGEDPREHDDDWLMLKKLRYDDYLLGVKVCRMCGETLISKQEDMCESCKERFDDDY